jgi:serine protease Do
MAPAEFGGVSPLFRHFFGLPKTMPKKFQQEIVGLGSGMIIDPEGHILTNSHVVSGATKIQVVLSDGRWFDEKSLKVIGTDSKTDLAVIQITAKGPFPHVVLGDSDKMEIGQWVVAIGQPRGLSQSVTQGIISAKHRMGITNPSSYEDFLQTDAAINPGNSGGPLINLQGEVIGINSAIETESGGFEGIGFAIPSNMAINISKQLITNGKVIRGYIGLSLQSLTPQLAESLGLTSTKGALVADVIKNSPACNAGFKKGDLMVDYEGKEIPDASSLRNAVGNASVGQTVTMSVIREGKKLQIPVKIGSEQEEKKLLSSSAQERLGVVVQPVSLQEAKKYGLEAGEGVEVLKVNFKGPLGKAGLEPKDIILKVNTQTIGNPEELGAAAEGLQPNKKAAFLVVDHRTGEAGYIQAVIP